MAKGQPGRESLRVRWLRRALLASSLALGLVLGGGIAFAYWTASIRFQPAPIRSGTFDMLVSTDGGKNWQDGPITWPAFSGAKNLYPGESYAEKFSVTIKNNSTGDHAFMVANIQSQVNFIGWDNGQYLQVSAFSGSGPTFTADNSNSSPHRSGTCNGTLVANSTKTIGALASTPFTYATTNSLAPQTGSQTIELCFIVTVLSGLSNPKINDPNVAAVNQANFSLTISAIQVTS